MVAKFCEYRKKRAKVEEKEWVDRDERLAPKKLAPPLVIRTFHYLPLSSAGWRYNKMIVTQQLGDLNITQTGATAYSQR